MQLLKIALNLLFLMISIEFLFFNKCQIILGRSYQTQ